MTKNQRLRTIRTAIGTGRVTAKKLRKSMGRPPMEIK